MRFLVFALALGAFAQEPSPGITPGPTQSGPLISFLTMTGGYLRNTTERPDGRTLRDAMVAVLRNEIHLTDLDIQAIQDAGDSFARRAAAIRRPYFNGVFEARLELAETGRESEAFRQKIERMNAQLAELEAATERDLRAAIGADRLQALDAWSRSPESKRCLVAPCVAKR